MQQFWNDLYYVLLSKHIRHHGVAIAKTSILFCYIGYYYKRKPILTLPTWYSQKAQINFMCHDFSDCVGDKTADQSYYIVRIPARKQYCWTKWSDVCHAFDCSVR